VAGFFMHGTMGAMHLLVAIIVLLFLAYDGLVVAVPRSFSLRTLLIVTTVKAWRQLHLRVLIFSWTKCETKSLTC
jgi:hypothetical protein